MDVYPSVKKHPVLWLCGLCLGAWVLTLFLPDGLPLSIPAAAGIAIIAGVLALVARRRKLTASEIAGFIFAFGFWIRVCYILATPVTLRQHDVWFFDPGFADFTYYRHGEYIQYIATYLKLPEVDPTAVGLSQLYHPPLHHLLAGLWLRLNTVLGVSFDRACESIQVLTLFYSGLCTLYGCKTLRLLKVKDTPFICGAAILSFHPTLILMSGSVNNDMLCTALSFIAVYATVKWYREPTAKNIIAIALSLGCAMMTKLSAGLLAPAIAFVFIYRWWKSYGEGKFGKTTVQFVIFGLICVPLGLWWPVKNAVLYQIPINFVPALSADSGQYLGGYSVAQRLFGCPAESFRQIFMCWQEQNGAPYNEYGSLLALLKTSLFGEFTLFYPGGVGEVFCKILFYVNLYPVGYSLYAALRQWALPKEERPAPLFGMLGIIWAVIMIGYVVFCFQYPQTCTQNFRYAVPTLLTGVCFMSMRLQRAGKGERYITYGFVTLFCFLSLLCYLALALA